MTEKVTFDHVPEVRFGTYIVRPFLDETWQVFRDFHGMAFMAGVYRTQGEAIEVARQQHERHDA